MILIECFTDAHMDNLATCLQLRPQTLVFLGDGSVMEPEKKRYREFLESHLSTQLHFCDIEGLELAEVCQKLHNWLNTNEKCVIDLTGGNTLAVMAVGAVLAKLDPADRSRIQVRKFDNRREEIRDCLTGQRLPNAPISLSVKEMISLHSGLVPKNGFQPPKEFCVADLEGLWQVVCAAPKTWNRRMSWLLEFESYSDSDTQVYLPLQHMRSNIRDYQKKAPAVLDLLEQFYQKGVIRDYRRRKNSLEYTYADPMLRYCTKKEGNVLEVKTLLEARELLENGEAYFGHCQMGVSIDWHDPEHPHPKQIQPTRNEIDVIAIHGTTPLFISCKNGHIGEEELYKLNSVAAQFGGPHAKKMLISTDLDQRSVGSDLSLVQRAWDMDIFPVSEAATLSKKQWREIFIKAML